MSWRPVEPREHDPACRRQRAVFRAFDPENCERCRNLQARLDEVAERRRAARAELEE